MGILDDIFDAASKAGRQSGVVRDVRLPDRQERQEVERLAKEYAPDFIAEGVSKLNRMAESFENVQDSINPAQLAARKLVREMSVEEAKGVLQKGDHVAVSRVVYSHHGIYDGDGFVYAYDNGIVGMSPLADFADGDDVYRVDDEARYTPEEILQRALSRFGEMEYHVVFNNCEHFAEWCRHGD